MASQLPTVFFARYFTTHFGRTGPLNKIRDEHPRESRG
jgi:hypothetical protein